MKYTELISIYEECKLDDRFQAIQKKADDRFSEGTIEWYRYIARECYNQGLI